MTENEKRLWMGFGALALLVLILWFAKSKSVTNNVTQTQTPGISVDIPAINLPPRRSIDIPNLAADNGLDFSMISGCACGGSTVAAYADPKDINLTINNYRNQNTTFSSPVQDDYGFVGVPATKPNPTNPWLFPPLGLSYP
jgi:hypothetical protein